MDFSKYVNEDLDNDIEVVFADMMDEGFEIKKDVSLIQRTYDIKITRRASTGLSFDIMPYKDHIKQLFDLFERKGIKLYQGYIYIDGYQKPLKDVNSLLTSDGVPPNSRSRTIFKDKTFEEMWDGLVFTIYCNSEKDIITNLTMTFCEK